MAMVICRDLKVLPVSRQRIRLRHIFFLDFQNLSDFQKLSELVRFLKLVRIRQTHLLVPTRYRPPLKYVPKLCAPKFESLAIPFDLIVRFNLSVHMWQLLRDTF